MVKQLQTSPVPCVPNQPIHQLTNPTSQGPDVSPQPLEDELSGEELRLLGSTLTVEVKPKTAPWAVYLGALGSDRSLDRWKEPHRNEANRAKSPKPAKRASSSALGHLLEHGFAHGRQLGQLFARVRVCAQA